MFRHISRDLGQSARCGGKKKLLAYFILPRDGVRQLTCAERMHVERGGADELSRGMPGEDPRFCNDPVSTCTLTVSTSHTVRLPSSARNLSESPAIPGLRASAPWVFIASAVFLALCIVSMVF